MICHDFIECYKECRRSRWTIISDDEQLERTMQLKKRKKEDDMGEDLAQ